MVAASSSVPAARGPGVYGSYVDEVLGYRQTVGGVASVYYPHGNHLYSVAALTNAAGQVVERYSYTAYGKQTITGPTGVVRQVSAVEYNRGFTGYITDNETGLLHARARQYSPTLGWFMGRDPWMERPVTSQRSVLDGSGRVIYTFQWGPSGGDGYQSGYGLYGAYFAPNDLDPSGMVIYGTFDVETGLLTIWDPDTGEHLVVPAESGGKPYGDPIPGGNWELLDGSSPDKYRLDPVDDNPRDDKHEKTGRDHFRLHKPGRTIGCIAVKDKDDWEKVKKMIQSTKTEVVEVISDCWWGLSTRKEKLKKYGEIRVVPKRP